MSAKVTYNTDPHPSGCFDGQNYEPLVPNAVVTTKGILRTSPERRRTARYVLSLEAECSWEECDGTTRTIVGLTREIGAYGATIITQLPPPPGAVIQVVVWVPNQSAGDRSPVRLRGKGTVIRLEGDGAFVAAVPFRVARAGKAEMPASWLTGQDGGKLQ